MNPFLIMLADAGIPPPEPEYRFHPVRRWRWDYCWPEQMIAMEIQGGTWTRGRHTRGRGYSNDCTKLNEGQLHGWRVFWFTTEMVNDGSAVAVLRRAFGLGE